MRTIRFETNDFFVCATKEDRLRAVMLYPESPEERSSYLRYRHACAGAAASIASRLADALIESTLRGLASNPEPIPSSLEFVERELTKAIEYDCGLGAASFSGRVETARNEERRRAAQGKIAGEILIYMLGPSSGCEKDGLSLGKARYVIEKSWSGVPKKFRNCGVSEKSIMDYWRTYRSASHFWAAEILAEGNDRYWGEDADHESRRIALLEWGEALLMYASERGMAGIEKAPPKAFAIPLEEAWRSPHEVPRDPELLPIEFPYENPGDHLAGYCKNRINKSGTGAAIRSAKP